MFFFVCETKKRIVWYIKMKIGVIHDYQPNLGGTTQIVIRMARALMKKGHKCTLIAHPRSWVRDFDKQNIDLVYAKKAKMTFVEYVPYTLTRVGKIVSLFKKGKIEICHAHYALPYSVSAYLAKQANGVPYIVTLHGTDVHNLAGMPSLKPVLKLCLENADAVTCVCQYLKKSILKKIDLDKEIQVIPNFVKTSVFRKKKGCRYLRKEFNIPQGYSVVTHISNFRRIKNTLIIPEIAKLVLEQNPNTIFLMVGGDQTENDLAELQKKVKYMGLKDNFRFAGRRKDVSKILNISNVSLMTSLNEGMPLVLLESLAVGVPVVTSRVGGIPELITHGANGYLIRKQNIEKYAHYIVKLLNSQELRQKLGDNGTELVRRAYSEDLVIDQYLSLYEQYRIPAKQDGGDLDPIKQ